MTSYYKTITPWGIFLFDFAIYKKCLWSEKSNLKLFSLEKYKIKQNIFWKLWSLYWVRGTPGNWVVKKCPSTGFVGGGVCGMSESLQYHKSGLIFPCSLNGFSRKCWVCSLFPKMSAPPSSFPCSQYQMGNPGPGTHLDIIDSIHSNIVETNHGGHHKILESIMLFLCGNKC